RWWPATGPRWWWRTDWTRFRGPTPCWSWTPDRSWSGAPTTNSWPWAGSTTGCGPPGARGRRTRAPAAPGGTGGGVRWFPRPRISTGAARCSPERRSGVSGRRTAAKTRGHEIRRTPRDLDLTPARRRPPGRRRHRPRGGLPRPAARLGPHPPLRRVRHRAAVTDRRE